MCKHRSGTGTGTGNFYMSNFGMSNFDMWNFRHVKIRLPGTAAQKSSTRSKFSTAVQLIFIISAHLQCICIRNCNMSFNHSRMVVGLLASPPLEVDAWLAVGRRPLGRRLPPREPLRVCPRDATAPSTSTVQLYSCRLYYSY